MVDGDFGSGLANEAISRLDSMSDALHDIEQELRAAGHALAALEVHAGTRNLRSAMTRLPRADDRGVTGFDASGVSEGLFISDGRDTGVMLSPHVSGVGRRTPKDDKVAVTSLTSPAAHDLGWDLLECSNASAFADDDLAAALLARNLAQVGWISPIRRCRWATSRLGAYTIVRLLRNGRPFALLTSGTLLDLDAVELVGGLGWEPELNR